MEFSVKIDNTTWAKIRAGDAFSSDEEALVAILASAFTVTGNLRASTELLIVTGKVKATKTSER